MLLSSPAKKIKFRKRLQSPSESKLTKPHCKEPIPKIRKNLIFPEKELCGHIYVYVRDLYISTMICLFCCRKYVDRSWEYINGSQSHQCGNWDRGHAVPTNWIHTVKWDFRCSAENVKVLNKFYQNSKERVIKGWHSFLRWTVSNFAVSLPVK